MCALAAVNDTTNALICNGNTSNTYDQTFIGNPPTSAMLNTNYMVSISQSNLKLNKFQQQEQLFSFKITSLKILTGISITIFGYC